MFRDEDVLEVSRTSCRSSGRGTVGRFALEVRASYLRAVDVGHEGIIVLHSQSQILHGRWIVDVERQTSVHRRSVSKEIGPDLRLDEWREGSRCVFVAQARFTLGPRTIIETCHRPTCSQRIIPWNEIPGRRKFRYQINWISNDVVDTVRDVKVLSTDLEVLALDDVNRLLERLISSPIQSPFLLVRALNNRLLWAGCPSNVVGVQFLQFLVIVGWVRPSNRAITALCSRIMPFGTSVHMGNWKLFSLGRNFNSRLFLLICINYAN